MSAVSDAEAPPSELYRAAVEHRCPSRPLPTAYGADGAVMSTIWKPPSSSSWPDDDMSAYVRVSEATVRVNVCTSEGPSSVESRPCPRPGASAPAEAAFGRAGSDTSIIWNPSSWYEATTAYFLAPTCTTSTAAGPSSSSNLAPSESVPPSKTAEATRGSAGSETSMTCTPSDSSPVMTAYVFVTDGVPEVSVNVSTDEAPPSARNGLPVESCPLRGSGSPSPSEATILLVPKSAVAREASGEENMLPPLHPCP